MHAFRIAAVFRLRRMRPERRTSMFRVSAGAFRTSSTCMKRGISVILSLLLVSCGAENGALRASIGETGSVKPSVSAIKPPDNYGSDPVDIRPETGIHVTAEKNSLYSDTKIEVSTVEENEMVYASALDLYDEGEYVLRAWDFDAGLNDDEALPGEYHVEIDLAEIGIPESLYDCMTAYRLNNYNELSEYSCTLKGSVLSYSTEKNSVSLLVAVPAVIVGVPAVMAVTNAVNEKMEKESYFSSEKTCHKKVVNEHGTYVLYWLMKDVDRHQAEKAARLDEIRRETKAQAERDYAQDEADLKYTKGSLYWLFNKNESVADRVKTLLNKNEEYQRLNREMEIPKNVQTILDEIDTAWNYLGSHEYVKMPSGTTEYQIRTGDGKNFGTAVSGFSVKSYIILNMENPDLFESESAAGQMMRDNMLLTITHETFHLCQERYHTGFFTDSNRFDEMVTLVLESDAKEYYQLYEYITTDPKLTDADYWISLTQPIDSEKFFSQLFMQEEGYVLSKFVQYLRKETKKDLPVIKLQNARSKIMYPGTSYPIIEAFGLTDKQFDTYFRKWCLENRKKFAECYEDMHTYEQYNPYPYQGKKLGRDDPVRMSFEDITYSAGVRVFTQTEAEPMALLLVPDSLPKGQSPSCNILPCGDYSVTDNGAFVKPQPVVKNESHKRRLFLEIYGNPKLGSVPDGYSVYPLASRKAPVLKKETDALLIRINDPSPAMKKGLMTGVLLNISTSEGIELQYKAAAKDVGKDLRLPLSNLNPNGSSDYTVEVSFAEYTTSSKGTILSAPESQTASLRIADTSDAQTFTAYLTEDTLTSMTDRALNEENVTGDPFPQAVTVTLNGSKASITLDGYTWSWSAKDRDFRMTSRSSRESIHLEGTLYKNDLSDTLYEGTIDSLPDITGSCTITVSEDGETNSGTVTISLSSMTKPGTIRIVFSKDGKISEGEIVLYGDFRRKSVSNGETYENSVDKVFFHFHS